MDSTTLPLKRKASSYLLLMVADFMFMFVSDADYHTGHAPSTWAGNVGEVGQHF